jgi:predicted permease
MEAFTTVFPIFVIIVLGWVARKRGFITTHFLEPANRLVYYLALPALVFNSIARTNFNEQFEPSVLIITLAVATLSYLLAELLARATKMGTERVGAFVQCSGHGNLGYIGLPIALYYLGQEGLAKAGIICGFLMIVQNFLSVVSLQLHGQEGATALSGKTLLRKLLGNPVIIAAIGGIAVSFLSLPLPKVVLRSLDILGGLGPPTALLLIGASLSLKLFRIYRLPAIGAVCLKLLVLPGLGLGFFHLFHLDAKDYLPAIILLSSPTATVAYVMAREMGGDADFSVAAISVSTLASALTFMFWLALVAELSG